MFDLTESDLIKWGGTAFLYAFEATAAVATGGAVGFTVAPMYAGFVITTDLYDDFVRKKQSKSFWWRRCADLYEGAGFAEKDKKITSQAREIESLTADRDNLSSKNDELGKELEGARRELEKIVDECGSHKVKNAKLEEKNKVCEAEIQKLKTAGRYRIFNDKQSRALRETGSAEPERNDSDRRSRFLNPDDSSGAPAP